MIPTYRLFKYYTSLNARILRYIRNKILKYENKEKPLVPKKIEINVPKFFFVFKDLEQYQEQDGKIGGKCRRIEYIMLNV